MQEEEEVQDPVVEDQQEEVVVEEEATDPVVEDPVTEETTEPQPNVEDGEDEDDLDERPAIIAFWEDNKQTCIIVIAVVGALLACCIGYCICRCCSSKKTPEKPDFDKLPNESIDVSKDAVKKDDRIGPKSQVGEQSGEVSKTSAAVTNGLDQKAKEDPLLPSA